MTPGAFEAILNSVSHHVSIMDPDGQIEWTNQSWDDFAISNGGKRDRTGVGVNYLDICAVGVAKGHQDTDHYYKNIVRVFDGTLPSFQFVYPCHSPDEDRWFLAEFGQIQWDKGLKIFSIHNQLNPEAITHLLTDPHRSQ